MLCVTIINIKTPTASPMSLLTANGATSKYAFLIHSDSEFYLIHGPALALSGVKS